MTTEKTIALTRWTFVVKVMSLFFNMLSRFVMEPTPVFLPGESHGQRSLADHSPWVAKSWTQQMVIAAMKLKDAYSLEGKL